MSRTAKASGEGASASASSSISQRVAALLELVGYREGGIGPRAAARETGIDRSAVSRIFRQLESMGWVQQVDDNGTYAAGPTLFAVAAAVRQRDSLWRAAAPFLRELAAEHNETTYLTVRDGERVVFTDQIESTHQLRYVVDLNKPYPLTTGAAGRAILGALASDAIDRILDEGLVAYTPQSIADPRAYRAQLAQDRELGYAYSASGWVVQGAGVASPYFDAEGECVGALTISAPIYRLDAAAAERLGPSVRSSANALSRRLGWSGRWGPPDGP